MRPCQLYRRQFLSKSERFSLHLIHIAVDHVHASTYCFHFEDNASIFSEQLRLLSSLQSRLQEVLFADNLICPSPFLGTHGYPPEANWPHIWGSWPGTWDWRSPLSGCSFRLSIKRFLEEAEQFRISSEQSKWDTCSFDGVLGPKDIV